MSCGSAPMRLRNCSRVSGFLPSVLVRSLGDRLRRLTRIVTSIHSSGSTLPMDLAPEIGFFSLPGTATRLRLAAMAMGILLQGVRRRSRPLRRARHRAERILSAASQAQTRERPDNICYGLAPRHELRSRQVQRRGRFGASTDVRLFSSAPSLAGGADADDY